MTRFHSDEYVKFIHNIRPDNIVDFNKQMQRCMSFSSFSLFSNDVHGRRFRVDFS